MASKIYPALMIAFLVELSLYFFAGGSYGNTALFSFLMFPTKSSDFYFVLMAILTASTTALIVASAFFQINQWALFGIAGITMISFSAVFMDLWKFINGQITSFAGSSWGGLIATLISAPLLLFFIISVVEWTRAN